MYIPLSPGHNDLVDTVQRLRSQRGCQRLNVQTCAKLVFASCSVSVNIVRLTVGRSLSILGRIQIDKAISINYNNDESVKTV